MYFPYKKVSLTDKQIKRRYSKLHRKYKIYLKHNDDFFVKLFFSIMLMEDFNRPWYLRIIEYLVFGCKLICNKKVTMTLGIMQIKTDCLIGNLSSIQLAEKMIIHILKEMSGMNESDKIFKVAFAYNPSKLYYDEITRIYNIIK